MSRFLSCCFMTAVTASTSFLCHGTPGMAGGKGRRHRSRGEGVRTSPGSRHCWSLQGIAHGPEAHEQVTRKRDQPPAECLLCLPQASSQASSSAVDPCITVQSTEGQGARFEPSLSGSRDLGHTCPESGHLWVPQLASVLGPVLCAGRGREAVAVAEGPSQPCSFPMAASPASFLDRRVQRAAPPSQACGANDKTKVLAPRKSRHLPACLRQVWL